MSDVSIIVIIRHFDGGSITSLHFDVNTIAQDSFTCYVLEIDLEYPERLHEQVNDLSFCPW